MPPIREIEQQQEEVSTIRRELHQNPQTSYEETFASNLIADRLHVWGIPHERGIAETGIVATLEGQRSDSGKALMLRADIDALDILEQTNLPHASRRPGKMHGCGHDGHTAILLGAAKYLSGHRDFNGKVHLVFQPAEEGGGGALRMIEEGVCERFPFDYAFGLHNWPKLPMGKIVTRVGPLLAAVDDFEIEIKASGGHAAMPHLTNDPLMVANQVAAALQTLVSRNVDPYESAVVTICNFNVGTGARNVIGDRARLDGTVRTFSREVRSLIKQRMHEVVQGTCAAFGATAEIAYHQLIDPTINTADGVEIAVQAASRVVGAENVETDFPPTMGGEDFGAFLGKRPGAFVAVGQGVGDPQSPHDQVLHSPFYDFNDRILPIGSSWFVELVRTYLPAV